ncbi:MAG: hypothetical protein M3P12_14895 [Gemmatimonadota bacterium]|nr:hypothetical protein [Gemmatimonadota bacterium]
MTGVRDMWTSLEDFKTVRSWRRDEAAGTLLGPRIAGSSTIVDGVPTIWPNSIGVTTAAEARRVVDSLVRGGSELIKVYTRLSRDAYFAIADRTKSLGIPFGGPANIDAPSKRKHSGAPETSTHMSPTPRQAWVRAALLAGLLYFLIGKVFPNPADHQRAWRLAAWLLSGAVYAAHIGYEHFRLRNAPRSTGFHAALAVAIGAFALALAGMIRSVSTGSGLRPAWLVSLVIWPAVTAIPAFLVALAGAAMLTRLSPTGR